MPRDGVQQPVLGVPVLGVGRDYQQCRHPPERVDLPIGSVIHIEPGTALQSANHGDADLLVYAYGTPPEDQHAELLDPAV